MASVERAQTWEGGCAGLCTVNQDDSPARRAANEAPSWDGAISAGFVFHQPSIRLPAHRDSTPEIPGLYISRGDTIINGHLKA